MRRVVLAFAALLCGCYSTVAAAEDCRLHQLAALKITQTSDGSLTVPVTLAGKQAVFGLNIDTAFSVVLASYADAGGFRRRPMPHGVEVHFEGEKVTGREIVPSFEIGNAGGQNLELLRVENADFHGTDVVGELGMDMLSNFDIELDVARNSVNLFTHDHCDGKVVYWPASAYAEVDYRTDPAGHALFDMKLDGKSVVGVFTTEPGSATMPMAAAKRVLGIDENTPGSTAISESRAQPKQYRYPFKTLSLGDIAVRNPEIALYGSSTDNECRPIFGGLPGQRVEKCFGGSDVSLGLQELRALHIFMATKEKKLYVTAAGAPAGEPRKIRP